MVKIAEQVVKMSTEYWLTNAEESLDYSYCRTVVRGLGDKYGKKWRLIAVSDSSRFEGYQLPRYSSGLRCAYKVGSEGADFLQLQSADEIAIMIDYDKKEMAGNKMV